ncbi:MAG: hypothetical protein ACREF3_18315 [Acetobacteraceae bacterium]
MTAMMTRDPNEGWHYDHWFVAPRSEWSRGLARARSIVLVCLLLAASSIVAVATTW